MFTPSGGDRPEAPNVVIVVTDQDSTADVDKVPEAAQKLKDSGAKIFTAGIGLDDDGELGSIASDESGALGASGVDGLSPIRDEIVRQTEPCKKA